MTSPVRVIVVGAGCRGEIYSQFASIHPDRVKVSGGEVARLLVPVKNKPILWIDKQKYCTMRSLRAKDEIILNIKETCTI